MQWLLFGHLVGVILLFGAIVVELLTLVATVRSSTIEQVRAATTFEPVLPVLFPVSVVLVLVFGLWMVGKYDEFKFGFAWIDLALGVVILLTAIGPTVQGRRMKAIRDAALTGTGPLTPELADRINDPVLRTSTLVSAALALSLVFLMAKQPGWGGAWAAVIVFGIAGVVASVLLTRFVPKASTLGA